MPFTIRYWRDKESSLRYGMFGKLRKPVGWQIGQSRYDTYEKAELDAHHINSQKPARPASVFIVNGRCIDPEDESSWESPSNTTKVER